MTKSAQNRRDVTVSILEGCLILTSSAFETPLDHGGNLDAAISRYGGDREAWLDLSTGINPVPYPVGDLSAETWTRLPDARAMGALLEAARGFWRAPPEAAILAAPGASALIARIPALHPPATVQITQPTYNEHEAAFAAAGWQIGVTHARARVMVHPNNPDGRLFSAGDIAGDLVVIDESFCDVCPTDSLIAEAARPGVLVIKSFGKFWGLAGLRLGFAIGDAALIQKLATLLGPWPVSGPAIQVGTQALTDTGWARQTRARLSEDRAWLDARMTKAGAQVAGGTDLFSLYKVGNAATWQDRLACDHVWTRIFPYATSLIRLGIPSPDQRAQLDAAL